MASKEAAIYNRGRHRIPDGAMEARLSSKYQLVIPKAVRERLGLRPGQRLIVLEKGGVIHLVPEQPLRALRGLVRGAADTDQLREKRDRY